MAAPDHMKRPSRGAAIAGAVVMLGCAAGTLAVLRGCQQEVTSTNQNINVAPVTIGGQKFMLEIAADNASRELGLGQRQSIEPRGGMIFVFPLPGVRGFVMRDCPIPIDIAYVDDAGRILGMYAMQPEEPRREGESREAYESRLKVYSSRFPCRFVIEVAGGTLAKLGVQPGDVVTFDAEALKKRAL